ncbi:PH domain-containing protein [Halorubrum ezzemoulense]|uniref:PH domain-containing protein n=1 Tax=Halorubrum ezzemoulense TaxID=337243 RepID=UPI00232D550A|nr:PH domain-containing protein [Halorubrum ezzemoulense]MDB9250059.1 PH domain-containing protein [Halorubrum ezzemoulense]MDB9260084.1 PH domain-containing protein [Halorubrum ezzemoulense]MDB9264386.1 PH domain-containing protein [Halorubrum ezzemoulense]MDB9267104.1 PH domain-containing protein [Halorubrum ezzemoulense]MDB9270445.1 PH domain-containing protein [Halorubrum ezzemoulense]
MGLFDIQDDEDIILENADLDCEPQNEYVSKTEVKKLDEYLDPGEKVYFLARDRGGQLKIDGDIQSEATGILTAATEQRVIFKTGKIVGSSQTSIDYKNISSVEVSFGMLAKRINLETDSQVFGIGVGQLGKDEVQDMAQFIREKMRESNGSDDSTTEQTVGSSENEEDPLDKLERLGELRDDGVITEEEFQEKKQSLLDQI